MYGASKSMQILRSHVGIGSFIEFLSAATRTIVQTTSVVTGIKADSRSGVGLSLNTGGGAPSVADLLHNPKCTGSSLSLNSADLLIRKRHGHHFFFLRATKQIHAFSEVVLKGCPAKIPVFCPLSLAHMWLTPTLVVVLIYDYTILYSLAV